MLAGKNEKESREAMREVMCCLQAATDQVAATHFYGKDEDRLKLKAKKAIKKKNTMN